MWLKDLTHNTTVANLVSHYRLMERTGLLGTLSPPPPPPAASLSPSRSPSPSPAPSLPHDAPAVPPAPPDSAPDEPPTSREHSPDGDGWGETQVPDSQECMELREENEELERAIRDIDGLLNSAPTGPDPTIDNTTVPMTASTAASPTDPSPAAARAAAAADVSGAGAAFSGMPVGLGQVRDSSTPLVSRKPLSCAPT